MVYLPIFGIFCIWRLPGFRYLEAGVLVSLGFEVFRSKNSLFFGPRGPRFLEEIGKGIISIDINGIISIPQQSWHSFIHDGAYDTMRAGRQEMHIMVSRIQSQTAAAGALRTWTLRFAVVEALPDNFDFTKGLF